MYSFFSRSRCPSLLVVQPTKLLRALSKSCPPSPSDDSLLAVLLDGTDPICCRAVLPVVVAAAVDGDDADGDFGGE